MLIIVRTILIQLALGFRSRVTLQAENAVLHHQVEILRRRAPRRVHVTRTDRLFFKLILRLWPKAAGLIRIVHPKTLVRWHREGFRLYWRWRSRKRGGRPKIPKEIRVLVRQMSTENPLWGAPRIHGELLKLGFDISQATVSRHMPKRRPNPDQTWKTFLLNHLHCTSSIDFLVVPTLTFRILYILVILSHDRRELVHFEVTTSPTAEWTARQITEAFPWDEVPRYIIRDRDCTYGRLYRDRIEAMGIHDVPTAPRSPGRRLCRTGHRLHPTRVSRSCHRQEREALAAGPQVLHGLLQQIPHTPLAEQRPAGPKAGIKRVNWSHRRHS